MQTTLTFGNPGLPGIENQLRKTFGFDGFRHGQLPLIEALTSGRDALGVMPTGGGKSLCFQLPALALPGTAVVVSPLIALMKDQVDGLRARGIAADFYNSSLLHWERDEVLERVVRGETKILYIAPERIQNAGFLKRLSLLKISLLAVDEAHCISHWGHDFRPDYMRLVELKRHLGNPPCIALTATATRRVQDDIIKRLELRDPVHIVTGFHRANLSFEVRPCGSRKDKLQALAALIKKTAATENSSAIVYAATRKNVEWLAGALRELGIRAGYYHAGMSDADRDMIQEKFQADKFPVLIATNAFGMGIDKPNIRLVAHYDIPGSMEAYYQEAGRAGRDGAPARCVLLFNHADVATQEFFIDKRSDSDTAKELLKQLVRYAYSKDCRQHTILDYFGDEEATRLAKCGHCDKCIYVPPELALAPPRVQDAGRQILACVGKLHGRFGKSRVAEILKGSNTAAIRTLGLQRQSSYGALRDWKLVEIRELLDELVESRYLKINGLEYPVVGLTEQGLAVAQGETPLKL